MTTLSPVAPRGAAEPEIQPSVQATTIVAAGDPLPCPVLPSKNQLLSLNERVDRLKEQTVHLRQVLAETQLRHHLPLCPVCNRRWEDHDAPCDVEALEQAVKNMR